MSGERIGIDLGGTKVEGVVLDGGGEIVLRRRVPTASERGYDHIVGVVAELIEGLAADAGPGDSIGIGTPGAVSRLTGRMKNSNTQCLNGRDLRSDLEGRLGRPVRVDNDANCFALAEASLGAGRGYEVVFGVIMGTGVGGGIAVGGRVLNGPQSIAGEWGHHSIDPRGPLCYCGNRGCVEAFLSGPAVQRTYTDRGGDACDVSAIVDRARAGEGRAALVLDELTDHFGRALANVISILDPDAVVLGGGLSNIDELYDAGRRRVADYVFNDELLTPILRNQLGDSAGVIGAALL